MLAARRVWSVSDGQTRPSAAGSGGNGCSDPVQILGGGWNQRPVYFLYKVTVEEGSFENEAVEAMPWLQRSRTLH